MSSYSAAAVPKVPRQERGERRVAKLLEAAEAVIAESGYEAATMSAIAERAGAAIGSLYQFFPSKACITQALRIEYAKRFDALYVPLTVRARTLNLERLVAHLIELTVRFVEAHPALPALLDAPRVTRAPASMRNVLRQRFAAVLLAQRPKLAKDKALRMGTVTLHVIKTLNQLYMELPPGERRRIVQEFKMLLLAYFNARVAHRSGRRTVR
ncbi:MAG TPA: TetR/AcrR family transcriptional regulator [Bryobacteraceae bacterium]|nr:TetR/AcrR family transcriptional regulator [Bryobacteraceae bacterium]